MLRCYRSHWIFELRLRRFGQLLRIREQHEYGERGLLGRDEREGELVACSISMSSNEMHPMCVALPVLILWHTPVQADERTKAHRRISPFLLNINIHYLSPSFSSPPLPPLLNLHHQPTKQPRSRHNPTSKLNYCPLSSATRARSISRLRRIPHGLCIRDRDLHCILIH